MTPSNKQVARNTKQLNRFLKLYANRNDYDDNETFCKRHDIKVASFYAMRSRLVKMGRVNNKSLEVVNTSPVTEEEFAATPYPYGKKKSANKRAGKKSNGKKAGETELLKEALTFPVEEIKQPDEPVITIKMSQLVNVIVKLVREGKLT